ncbi:hypothetical protein [Streptomyces sp. NPDC049915]|uniref:hypothetical protein n=1 Tax=Streptomyces sp. NPDC049915 TaxID=3155510 RepID=UPI00341C003F
MVPLAEAWDSGAWHWSPEEREAYANDLGDDRALIAVSATSNRSKADQDPTTWLSPAEGSTTSSPSTGARRAANTTRSAGMMPLGIRAAPAGQRIGRGMGVAAGRRRAGPSAVTRWLIAEGLEQARDHGAQCGHLDAAHVSLERLGFDLSRWLSRLPGRSAGSCR